ncbi:MAG: hypothetical protein IJQ18_06845 [Paludibacteraceae bacterium]|nr:hypothetical protein [Paludibacteraceae bacterium]
MDVTIRIADAKKSNEVFPNNKHKIAKNTKKMQNYLVMSEKSSNFARFFCGKARLSITTAAYEP